MPVLAVIDSVQFILGDVQDDGAQARFQLQRPEIKLRDPNSGEIVGTVRTDVPDLFLLTGSLPASALVKQGATLHARFRKGPPFKGEPAFVWTISGEEGELRLVSPAGPALQANSYSSPVTIEVHDFATDQLVPVAWEWSAWQLEIPLAGRSIAALYEAFAAGDESAYATFEDALRRHEQLDTWLGDFQA